MGDGDLDVVPIGKRRAGRRRSGDHTPFFHGFGFLEFIADAEVEFQGGQSEIRLLLGIVGQIRHGAGLRPPGDRETDCSPGNHFLSAGHALIADLALGIFIAVDVLALHQVEIRIELAADHVFNALSQEGRHLDHLVFAAAVPHHAAEQHHRGNQHGHKQNGDNDDRNPAGTAGILIVLLIIGLRLIPALAAARLLHGPLSHGSGFLPRRLLAVSRNTGSLRLILDRPGAAGLAAGAALRARSLRAGLGLLAQRRSLTGIHIGRRTARPSVEAEHHLGVLSKGLQVLNHSRCRAVPGAKIRTHGVEGDLLQTEGDRRIHLAGRRRGRIDVLDGDGYRGITVIGRFSGQHFIHHYAQRIQVRPGVHLGPLCLLRGDIMDGPQRLPGQRILGGTEPRDPEISDLYAAVLQDHDIVRFDVPMDDPSGMGVLDGLGDLGGKMQRLPPGQRAPLLHILLEGQPVDQFHDDIVRFAGMVHVIDGHDIGVGEHRDGLAFGMEPPPEILVAAEFFLEDLHRHIPVEPVIHGPIDHGHAAPADFLQYFITAVQQATYEFIHNTAPSNDNF